MAPHAPAWPDRLPRAEHSRYFMVHDPIRMEAGVIEKAVSDKPQATTALQLLNFFMADIQAGIGPFLGVFLLARWHRRRANPPMTCRARACALTDARVLPIADELQCL